jgi:hypothetical protein
MVRTGVWKMDFFMDSRVNDKDGALYNLRTDPSEQNNLYNNPAYRNIITELEHLAHEWSR